MKEALKPYYERFKNVLERKDLTADRKEIQLSQMMIDLETEFKIPKFKNDLWEMSNKDVLKLYFWIDRARTKK